MSLRVSSGAARVVLAAAEAAFPQECCGLLLGSVPDDFDKIGRRLFADSARELTNGWEASARTHRYAIDPLAVARIEAELSGTGRGIVGIYHSHPSAPAWPSPFDLERAWPCCSYWIVSVREGRAVDSRCWMRTEDGRSFVEEEIYWEERP